MAREAERIYPHCPTVISIVPIGGLTKGELLSTQVAGLSSRTEEDCAMVAVEEYRARVQHFLVDSLTKLVARNPLAPHVHVGWAARSFGN